MFRVFAIATLLFLLISWSNKAEEYASHMGFSNLLVETELGQEMCILMTSDAHNYATFSLSAMNDKEILIGVTFALLPSSDIFQSLPIVIDEKAWVFPQVESSPGPGGGLFLAVKLPAFESQHLLNDIYRMNWLSVEDADGEVLARFSLAGSAKAIRQFNGCRRILGTI